MQHWCWIARVDDIRSIEWKALHTDYIKRQRRSRIKSGLFQRLIVHGIMQYTVKQVAQTGNWKEKRKSKEVTLCYTVTRRTTNRCDPLTTRQDKVGMVWQGRAPIATGNQRGGMDN